MLGYAGMLAGGLLATLAAPRLGWMPTLLLAWLAGTAALAAGWARPRDGAAAAHRAGAAWPSPDRPPTALASRERAPPPSYGTPCRPEVAPRRRGVRAAHHVGGCTPLSPLRGISSACPDAGFEIDPPFALSPNPLIRVLIVEDHQMFAEALARALRDEPDIRVDGISQRLDDAREFLRRNQVDVVLMDYHLPDGDGIVAARYIREEHPRTWVLVVSAVEDRQVLDDALTAGCSGFISKAESLDHLPSAIRGAMVGNIAISPAMVAKLIGPTRRRVRATATISTRESSRCSSCWPRDGTTRPSSSSSS